MASNLAFQIHRVICMRTIVLTSILSLFACVLCLGVFASDAYYDAERSAKDFLYYYEEFTKLNKQNTQNLVTAIADGDQDERREIAQRASSEAKDKVTYGYEKAEKRKDEALGLLDVVLKDPTLKDKYSAAEELKRKVNDTWASIQRMSAGIRGANHPVVAYMLQKGKELHETRQRGCPVYEFETGNGPADCIRTSCDIIEFKPDNSRAKYKGEDQLKRYRKGILENPSKRTDLESKSSDFAKCQDFRLAIEAYTLLPEINDDGTFREPSVSWSTYTVNP